MAFSRLDSLMSHFLAFVAGVTSVASEKSSKRHSKPLRSGSFIKFAGRSVFGKNANAFPVRAPLDSVYDSASFLAKFTLRSFCAAISPAIGDYCRLLDNDGQILNGR